MKLFQDTCCIFSQITDYSQKNQMHMTLYWIVLNPKYFGNSSTNLKGMTRAPPRCKILHNIFSINYKYMYEIIFCFCFYVNICIIITCLINKFIFSFPNICIVINEGFCLFSFEFIINTRSVSFGSKTHYKH